MPDQEQRQERPAAISAETMALVRNHLRRDQDAVRESLRDKKAAKARQRRAIEEKRSGRTLWNDAGFSVEKKALRDRSIEEGQDDEE